MTAELVDWLTNILDEDAKAAERSGGSVSEMQNDNYGQLLVPKSWMLSDIEAKRAILVLHQPGRPADTWWWLERECAGCGSRWHESTPLGTPPTVVGPERGCPTIRLLASAYAHRPGYREGWRP